MANEKFKSGFVAILGRPNVGKSTLLNVLVGNKISIISPVPQTTRYQIRGILNLEEAQIVFVDTPGMHFFKDELADYLNTIARKSISGCDLILYLADISRPPGREEEVIMDFLSAQNLKTIAVLNKIDLGIGFVNDYIYLWKEKVGKREHDPLIYYLPISAKTGKNISHLKDLIVENLPNQPPFYDVGTLTDFPLIFRIADIVREKLFLNLREELPHSLAVAVEELQEKEAVMYIKVNIYVNRDSQKKIIIGERGKFLKNIGKEARLEIEKIYGRKVYLDLWVKVLGDWQKKPRILKELGYF